MRLTFILKSKLSRFLDRFDDPFATLDYAYEKHQGLLREFKRGLVEVVTAKKRLEVQADQLTREIDKLQTQARHALVAGREDLARAALERKQGFQAQREGLLIEIAKLESQQANLTESQSRYAERLAAFRDEKEVAKAQYRTAELMVAVGEVTQGIGKDLMDTGHVLQRAKEQTTSLQARAAALGELETAGAFESSADRFDRELGALAIEGQVEQELAALKGALPAPQLSELGTAGPASQPAQTPASALEL